jgi:hypothetical protein
MLEDRLPRLLFFRKEPLRGLRFGGEEMSRYHYFKPHVVRFVQAKYGRCLLCGKEAKGSMIWIKGVGVACPSHEAYALVYEYDNGYHTSQMVVKVFATEEEAESECKELNRRMAETRVAIGFRPASYTVKRLRELVGLQERVTELEEE